jgi:two-component system cell cycle sensor histidine kinase/response regulator CckA
MEHHPLCILILDDNPDDAYVLERELRRAGVECTCRRAGCEAAFLVELTPAPDLILADSYLPSYGAMAAMRALADRGLEVPVIVVSGTSGEEAAAECLREGATDYLLKDRLGRLGSAVRNAVQQARLRREQLRMTEALRLSEEQYRLLFEEAPFPMWVVDGETLRFLEVNRRTVSTYSCPREQFLTMTILDIWEPQDVPDTLEGIRNLFAGDPGTGRRRHHTGSGEVLEVSVATRPLVFAGRQALLAIIDDFTDRHRLEAQLRQAQKMEAVGLLAGGVAHDFNNTLTTVLGYAELLRGRLAERPDDLDLVAQVYAAGERGAALTRQLLAFSRKQTLQPRIVELGAVVAGIEGMLRRLIGESIELAVHLEPAAGAVLVDPGQIEQVIVNLAINARDAMPDGGRLLIETAGVELDAAEAAAHARMTAGPHVLLAVSDSGCGMDAATRSRIFEPFFTTKPPGAGTGLGLATVYGIVEQSGGRIEVASEPGKGSTFKVYLPRTAGAVDSTSTAAAGAAAELPAGSETLLVVEDDPALRRLTCIMLEAGGYTVFAEQTAAAAIAFAEVHAGPIHLALTDVVMPGMNGAEVAARLAALRPEARLLYMSGYTGEVLGRRGLLSPGTAVLEKPFNQQELLRRVRELLDTAPAR